MPTDLLLRIVNPGEQQLRKVFVFAGALPCQGVQTVANRFLKAFLTLKGSDPYAPTDGTELTRRQYRIDGDDPELLQVEVLEYIQDAVDQVKAYDALAPARVASERMGLVNLLDLNVTAAGLELWVEVVALSGERLKTIVPYFNASV